ncbi:MAG: DUF1735 domain-containing protein [Prevotella sp.]|nr:DUF1735 domain-containing protein [Prevotella sp.]
MLKHFVYCFFAVAALTLTSCSDDEKYDVVGNPNNLVYFKANAENTFTGMIIHTPVGDFGDIAAKFPVRILRPATQDTHVTAIIDNSMVATYNEANSTNYEAIPESAIDASQLSTTIRTGNTQAEDSIEVSIREDALASLTAPAYLLPVRIAQVSGDGSASEERGFGYVIVETETKLIKTISDASEMPGTLLTSYDGWTASYSSGTSINSDELFDQNLGNGPQLRTDADGGRTTTVVVDMKEEKKVSGLRVARYWMSYWGGWWIEEYYFSSVKLEISTDGQKFSEVGTAQEADMPKADGYQHIAFYGAVPARYLRLTIQSGDSSVSSLAELGVYSN